MRNKQCLCGIYDDIRTTAKIVAPYDYFCSDFILFFFSNQELYGLSHFYSFILCKYTLLTTTRLFLFRVQSYDDYFKPLLNDLLYDSFRQRVFSLKIRLHSKQELLDKDFLESSDVILFIKHEHSLLVVYGVNGSERNRAIAICY